MKLILTNDDGIEAEGLQTLVRLASRWGEVVIVAPAEPQSGIGHQLTTDRPIRVDELAEDRYRIWGTPADCSRLALNCLASDGDWVLSGINHGGNLGVDVYESGTVAAAREAAIHGCKAVALSHYTVKGRSVDWPLAAERLRPVLDDVLNGTLEAGYFLNVNLPHEQPDVFGNETHPGGPKPPQNYILETIDGFLYTGVYQERWLVTWTTVSMVIFRYRKSLFEWISSHVGCEYNRPNGRV